MATFPITTYTTAPRALVGFANGLIATFWTLTTSGGDAVTVTNSRTQAINRRFWKRCWPKATAQGPGLCPDRRAGLCQRRCRRFHPL